MAGWGPAEPNIGRPDPGTSSPTSANPRHGVVHWPHKGKKTCRVDTARSAAWGGGLSGPLGLTHPAAPLRKTLATIHGPGHQTADNAQAIMVNPSSAGHPARGLWPCQAWFRVAAARDRAEIADILDGGYRKFSPEKKLRSHGCPQWPSVTQPSMQPVGLFGATEAASCYARSLVQLQPHRSGDGCGKRRKRGVSCKKGRQRAGSGTNHSPGGLDVGWWAGPNVERLAGRDPRRRPTRPNSALRPNPLQGRRCSSHLWHGQVSPPRRRQQPWGRAC